MAQTKMTDEDKTARRAVRDYLAALESNKPKRGRKRTAQSIQTRLDTIQNATAEASPLKRLELAQERLDLTTELQNLETTIDLEALEANFTTHAKHYGDAKGITRAAWREIGVTAATLKAAGI